MYLRLALGGGVGGQVKAALAHFLVAVAGCVLEPMKAYVVFLLSLRISRALIVRR